MLGCNRAALWGWQRATRDAGWRRRSGLLRSRLGLLAAVAFHYFAILALVPLAVAEGVRSLGRREIDRAVWAALAVAPLPIFLSAPLLVHGSATGHPAPSPLDALLFYQQMFLYTPPPLLLLLVPLAFVTVNPEPPRPSRGGSAGARR